MFSINYVNEEERVKIHQFLIERDRNFAVYFYNLANLNYKKNRKNVMDFYIQKKG